MDSSFAPSDEVMTTIVLPTIIFCIGMVVAMLVGINKCKQWELDKICEMRRTRRALQKMTNRLREKNFNTIQKARNMRKRATLERKTSGKYIAPPLYESIPAQPCGTSPPPSYEDALLDDYYYECHPSHLNPSAKVPTTIFSIVKPKSDVQKHDPISTSFHCI
ncbi:hypothetical protein WR25_12776 [Diploscapter pachys]|uniref:Uncharacterized protein n=1 Tax=Diploscapter pachys TaxID=2018661 RepID=A0A2A2KTE6_9BILA|nr:hypothetical protein WR25_12776 [Diploscapter pachys]